MIKVSLRLQAKMENAQSADSERSWAGKAKARVCAYYVRRPVVISPLTWPMKYSYQAQEHFLYFAVCRNNCGHLQQK